MGLLKYTDKLTRNLKALGGFFRRFPFISACRFAASFIWERVFRLQYQKSYAEKGEDIVLAAMLPSSNSGFYVEVGCYHPVRKSNTFRFYKFGWHGIVVDANPVHLDRYRHLRPLDTVIEAAVSDTEHEAELMCYQESAYSTISQSAATDMGDCAGGQRSVRKVRTRTLTSILDQHNCPRAFDMLSIDCEGHDFEVLRSLDIERYRPKVIIIEDHDFRIAECGTNPVVKHLESRGYVLAAFCLNNLYFRTSKSIEA